MAGTAQRIKMGIFLSSNQLFPAIGREKVANVPYRRNGQAGAAFIAAPHAADRGETARLAVALPPSSGQFLMPILRYLVFASAFVAALLFALYARGYRMQNNYRG